MTEKDVQIEIANGVLTLRGEKKAERMMTENCSRSATTVPSSGNSAGWHPGGQGGSLVPRWRADDHAAEVRAGSFGGQTHRDHQAVTASRGGAGAPPLPLYRSLERSMKETLR